MRPGIPAKWSFILLSVAGIVFATTVVFFLAPIGKRAPAEAAQSTAAPQRADATVLPVHLRIPAINIDAALEHVGLTSRGTMAVPEGPGNAAWFDLGPLPGQTGSAVIAGHEGWKDGIAAVFDDLYKLKPGDKVYVKNSAGTDAVFVMRKVQTYGENADAATIFNSNDGNAHLNLITCEGKWNAAQKSYSNRLVVFTDEQ